MHHSISSLIQRFGIIVALPYLLNAYLMQLILALPYGNTSLLSIFPQPIYCIFLCFLLFRSFFLFPSFLIVSFPCGVADELSTAYISIVHSNWTPWLLTIYWSNFIVLFMDSLSLNAMFWSLLPFTFYTFSPIILQILILFIS